MDASIFITPLAGAAIGYFTNWLAIKMLFRPYKPITVFGHTMPFTPGLIPKEKEKISKRLGETVATHLLTADRLAEELASEEFLQATDKMLADVWKNVSEISLTLDQIASKLLKEEKEAYYLKLQQCITEILLECLQKEDTCAVVVGFVDKILDKKLEEWPVQRIGQAVQDFIVLKSYSWKESGVLTNLLEKNIWEFLLKLREREEPLSAFISLEEARAVKDYIALKTPVVALSLLKLAREQPIRGKLRDKLAKGIQAVAGPLVGMFIGENSAYDKILDSLESYFSDVENQAEIEEYADAAVEYLLQYSLGEAAAFFTAEVREDSVFKLVEKAITRLLEGVDIRKVIARCMSACEKYREKTGKELLSRFFPDYRERLGEAVQYILEPFWKEQIGTMLAAFIKGQFQQFVQTPVSNIVQKADILPLSAIKPSLFAFFQKKAADYAPAILKAVDVSNIVEKQINSFAMEETEELILSVANRELRAITIMGGILGFVIGWVPFLLSMIH